MKKAKVLSFLLSSSLLVSAIIPGTLAAPADVAENPEGMEISKTAADNGDGTYTITLEAYATGEKISTEVTKDIPTDIILVLDQSGSMAKEDFPSVGETTYEEYTNTRNSNLYSKRHNQERDSNKNLYYKLSNDSYATVSVERTQEESSYQYTECPSTWKNGALWGDDNYYANQRNLYVKVGEEYQKVELDRAGGWRDGYIYTYTFPDGSKVVSDGRDTSPGNFNGKGPLYVRSETQGDYIYTYTCVDEDGNTINIGTSTGADTRFTDKTLYYRNVTNGGNITRLQALKNAVTQFENSVAEKAKGEDGILGTEDDVDHRIAVVGFASGDKWDGSNYYYGNTEVFVGAQQYRYGANARGQYRNAFQSMNTQQGQDNVNASIGVLAAEGGTIINLGMEMANGILDANPVPQGEKRNRVVIVFTDGVPGWSGYDSSVANAAITQANTARNNGANVYAVGIFNGADATSAGNQNGNDTQQANWFMQNLSDNKGTPQTPSYYLSASDSNTLNSIFQQISDQIQEGGSAIDLGSEAVIKDIISPQFQLPAGAAAEYITLETYSYTGEDQWSKNEGAMGAAATVNGDQVSVTGFDFKENWCGTETTNGTETYRGNKLVISFSVEVKNGFLGGNDVFTNTSAGVYENSAAENPLFIFERPQVDVAIKKITVTPEDKNVYLMGGLTADQIKSGATAVVGNVELGLAEENYGLEPWQYEYVDITVTYQNKDGNTVTDLNDLADDSTYTVSVGVTPKTEGDAVAQTGSGRGNINVFKPELTYKDSEVYYGDSVPADFSGNLVSTIWKHGETSSTDTGITVIGEASTLGMDYTPDASKIADGKINTKQDVLVDVTVKIGDMEITNHAAFTHQGCKGQTCNVPKGNEFLLHVKTCQLTITKIGGADDEPYVFNIMKDGVKYSEATIVGNNSETIYELPVGTYTIQEDTDWSWRYPNPVFGNSVTLSRDNTNGAITCTNYKNISYWLNGFSNVVKNIFGASHSN